MGIFLDKLTKKMNDGKIVCGVCVALNDPAVSELVGMAGYDFVWIEGEHGAMGRKEMQDLMIGAHAGGGTPGDGHGAGHYRFPLYQLRTGC